MITQTLPAEVSLWEQYCNPAESLEPLLYAQRYDSARLAAHRDNVIGVLVSRGAEIFSVDDDALRISLTDLPPESHVSTAVLIEELGVLNNAHDLLVQHDEQGRSVPSTSEIIAGIVSEAALLLRKDALNISKVDAYDAITLFARMKLRLIVAHWPALTGRERAELVAAYGVLKTLEHVVDGRHIIFGGVIPGLRSGS